MASKISSDNPAKMLLRAKDKGAITPQQFDQLLAGLAQQQTLAVIETAGKIERALTEAVFPL